MAFLEAPPYVLKAREHWRYRGQERPSFADPTNAGQESVWDFPRPPRIEAVADVVRVLAGATTVAESRAVLRVLETAGAPTYYVPGDDVDTTLLTPVRGRSLCEWKGEAQSYDVAGQPRAAWSYPRLFPEFAQLENHYAFYATALTCFIGDEQVRPQPGGFYGGWVTDRLTGPIKGEAGSEPWW